jgi:deoxyribose-phosphate aldolase
MLAVVGNECQVKASGGVRDFAAAAAYISAGVRRIGTSSGVQIVAGKSVNSGY